MERNKSRRLTNLAFMAACVVAGPGTTASAALLYSIDTNANQLNEHQLVVLDTVGGTVTVIGTGLGQVYPRVTNADLAIANGVLYAVDTDSTVDVHLLDIDTLTGAVVEVCPVTYLGNPVLTDAEGLAQVGGNLYIAFRIPGGGGLASASHAVGELRPCSSGVAVIVPSTVIDYLPSSPSRDFDGLTEFPCGLTDFPAGHLFAVDHYPGTPQTHTYFELAGTIVFSATFLDNPSEVAVNDLAFCGGELFGIDDGTKQVSLHDPTTGAILTYVMPYPTQSSLRGLACRESCVEAPSSMVAWWPLDEDPGPTAQDIVGGNHGTHVNVPAPLAGEVVDNSLCFNGMGQYVEVLTATPLNLGALPDSDFTIDAWVRADNVTGTHPIVDKIGSGPTPRGYQLFVVNGRLGFRMADSACADFVASTPDVTVGVWHHVAVTGFRSIGQGSLYVDGNLVHTFTPLSQSLANTADLSIGRSVAGPCTAVNAFWEGCIDEVEFFDQALPPDDILLIHDACRAGKCKPGCCLPAPDEGDCTTMWDMDCLAIMGGTPVTPCLGDLDLNGIDDACECDLVDDGVDSYCEGACPALGGVEECVPRCVNFDQLSGQSTVTECDCRTFLPGQTPCGVVFDPGEPEPSCAGNCPDNTLLCVKTVTDLGNGVFEICCDCATGTHNRTFALEALPEPAGTTASEALAISITEEGTAASSKRVAGRVKDSAGVWRAHTWHWVAGTGWTGEPLPVADPSADSTGNGIACYRETDWNFICRVGGSVGNPGSEQPAVWEWDGTSWTTQPVGLPAGFIGGRVLGWKMWNLDGKGRGSVREDDGTPGGTDKACIWEWDGSAWQPTLLPGLATDPVAAESESYGHMEDIACGVAQDDSGNDKPVVWTFDAGLQTWNPPIELPLLSGGTQGLADNGLVFDDAGTLVTIVIGTSETSGGNTHGVLWRQVAGGPWEAPIDLPPLLGMANSKKKGVIRERPPTGGDPGGGTTIIVVGASYDGPDTDVATMWEVDPSVSPAVRTITDFNFRTPNLPENLTLGEATAASNDQTGREDTILCQAFELGGGRPVGATDPHAVVLTEVLEPDPIPTVSEWGLIVMTLLFLTAGTLVYVRRGGATPRPTPGCIR